MIRFLISFIVLISFSSLIFSQNDFKFSETTKVDEFTGVLPECDLGARVDNLFIYLQANPNSKGKIIIYKGLNVLPGNYENQNLWLQRNINNFIGLRGYDRSKVEIVETGFRDKQITELWIIPEGAKSPELTNLKPKPKLPKNRTYLYNINYLFLPYMSIEPYRFLLPKIKAELDADKDYNFKKDGENETKIYEENKYFWLSSSFGEVLKNNPKLYGEIIFYADDTRLDVEKIRNVIKNGKKELINNSKILPDRIKITFGGYRDVVQAEFWIVSHNDKQPVPTPEERTAEKDY